MTLLVSAHKWRNTEHFQTGLLHPASLPCARYCIVRRQGGGCELGHTASIGSSFMCLTRASTAISDVGENINDTRGLLSVSINFPTLDKKNEGSKDEFVFCYDAVRQRYKIRCQA